MCLKNLHCVQNSLKVFAPAISTYLFLENMIIFTSWLDILSGHWSKIKTSQRQIINHFQIEDSFFKNTLFPRAGSTELCWDEKNYVLFSAPD